MNINEFVCVNDHEFRPIVRKILVRRSSIHQYSIKYEIFLLFAYLKTSWNESDGEKNVSHFRNDNVFDLDFCIKCVRKNVGSYGIWEWHLLNSCY